jgi:hypothetical protein
MPSINRLIVLTGALAALIGVPAGASAGARQPFHLEKTCREDPSEPLGYICTVERSDFKWIPGGTNIRYLGQTDNVVQARIEIDNGTSDGECTWSSDVDAVCVFRGGTGRLTQFNLEVVVTASPDQSTWYWDGTYWFGQ